MKYILVLILAYLYAGGLFAQKVIFLHFNDEHGNYPGIIKDDGKIHSMTHLAAWVETIKFRNRGTKVFLTFGGDMNSGTPESDEMDARADVHLMNFIGVDVAVLGNHEFDKPISVLDEQLHRSSFPWICSNVYYKDKRDFILPYQVISAGKYKIAFVGMVTRHTEKIGNPSVISALEFTRPLEEYQNISATLQNRVDAFVVLSHLGNYPAKDGKREIPDDYDDEITFLEKAPKDKLILLLGGHSHDLVAEHTHGIPVMQSECCLKYLSLAEFEFSETEKPRLVRMESIPLNQYPPEFYRNDSWWNEYLRKKTEGAEKITRFYLDGVGHKFNKIIGSTQVSLEQEKGHHLRSSTPLGNFIADSQKELTGADAAIMNAGGIRRDLPLGDIKVRNVISILPFKNPIGIVEMTGQELRDILFQEIVVNQEGGGFPQVSGMEIEAVIESREIHIFIGGRALDMEKKYTVAINSYLANGGMGYPNFVEQKRFQTDGLMDYRLLQSYIEKIVDITVPMYEQKWQSPRIRIKK